ncbi:MAG: phosphoribosylamine---glycine ligase [Chloroflexota bacterium]|jgi:phosphoribosylamine--glycine ligase|nr:phosphoribosylamine---glycine ligase [Chloroflexota bacterium]
MSMPVMPTRILIVGGGGREHALAWKLAAEPGVNQVWVAPGSAGIGLEPRVGCLREVDALVPAAVVAAARSTSAELVVIGPEAPLAAGVADALAEAGVTVFGPSRAAAQIETSKAFCHEVAAAAGVPMARSRAFAAGQLDEARAFAAELAAAGHGLVVKADGLAAGKGVRVCDDLVAAEAQLADAFDPAPSYRSETPGAPRVVVEERLFGLEVSVIAVTDGRFALALPSARDHKRLLDGDRGPNTGGMGAYSPVADLPDADAAALLATIHRPILAELARRGTPFRGFLYAGLILTADGPVLLECNARLGDPEAQVILPRLAGPLGPVLLAAALGELRTIAETQAADVAGLPTLPGATVGIVLAAEGYPDTPRRGQPIEGLEEAVARGGLVFHAGSLGRPGGGYGTNGGRVLTVVGRGPDVTAARAAAERAADAIAWDGLQRRHDIAAGEVPVEAPAEPQPATAGGASR